MTREPGRPNRDPEPYWVEEPVDSIDVTFDSIEVTIVPAETPARLVRAIACISPPRLGRRSRARELLAETIPELVHVLPRAALVLGVAMFITGLMVGPRTMKVFAESKADIARATVKKYAFEAYPSWRVEHPDAVCPERLDDLNEYMNNKDVQDPWQGFYEMSCSDFGILVWTAGEDARPGTADDIRSDE